VNGVHQGFAGSVFLFKVFKIIAADLKGCYTPGCVFNPDPAQASAFA